MSSNLQIMIQFFFSPRDNKASDNTLEASATLVGSGSSGSTIQQPEALNKKALDIVQRVRDKLTGNFTNFLNFRVFTKADFRRGKRTREKSCENKTSYDMNS